MSHTNKVDLKSFLEWVVKEGNPLIFLSTKWNIAKSKLIRIVAMNKRTLHLYILNRIETTIWDLLQFSRDLSRVVHKMAFADFNA